MKVGLGTGGAGAMGRQDGSGKQAPSAGWRKHTTRMGTGKGGKEKLKSI